MKPVTRRETLLRQIAEESSRHVLLESTRAAIEKMAEEFARDAWADPEYRELVRGEVRAAVRELVAALRAVDPEVHGKKSP